MYGAGVMMEESLDEQGWKLLGKVARELHGVLRIKCPSKKMLVRGQCIAPQIQCAPPLMAKGNDPDSFESVAGNFLTVPYREDPRQLTLAPY